MERYEYKGNWYTVNELSELSGINQATIRARLRRGYSVDGAIKITPIMESVERFSEASWWEDWVGMSTSDLYKIYWKWCISRGYTTFQIVKIQTFSKQIFQLYPNLKTIPTKRDNKSFRVIREK